MGIGDKGVWSSRDSIGAQCDSIRARVRSRVRWLKLMWEVLESLGAHV